MRPSKEMRSPLILSSTNESTGRIRHDERGAAVWDWTIDTGVFEGLSATGLMRRLEVADLEMQETPSFTAAGRDAGGGGDPYNFRGAVPLRSRQR